MKNFLIGLIIMGVGFLITWKAYWIVENFGRDEWAESKLAGGTTAMYRIVGVIAIFFGMLLATGLMRNFLKATLGSIFMF